MSDTVLLAVIAVASPVLMATVTFLTSRANKREDWRRQDEVAGLVATVAVKAEASAKTLEEIKSTGNATHALVNSGRTANLRTIAVLARVIAVSQPENAAAQEAADAAEKALAQNELDNKVAAEAKLDHEKATEPLPAAYAREEQKRRA